MAEDKQRGIAEYEAIVKKFPDYIFARCVLAEHKIAEGQLEEANELISNLLNGKKTIHIQDLISVSGVTALLKAAQGDEKSAMSNLELPEKAIEFPGEQEQLDMWKNKVDKILHPEDYPLQAADIELLRKNMFKLMEMSEEEN